MNGNCYSVRFEELAELVGALTKGIYELSDFETRYERVRLLGWNALKQAPTDRRLYRMLFDTEHAYRQWQQFKNPEDQGEAHAYFDAETYRLYEFALQHNPNWAGAQAYLGNLDAEAERCDMARHRFLEGMAKGDVASEVTFCFYQYLSVSSLWVATQWPCPVSCGMLNGISLPDALERLEADWTQLQALVPILEERSSPDVVDTCKLIRLAILRGQAGWTLLKSTIPEPFLSNLDYRHLQRIMWPVLLHPYEPSRAVEMLGLEKQWPPADTLRLLQWDLTFQRILLQLDVNRRIVRVERELLMTAELNQKRKIIEARLLAGDSDGPIQSLRFLMGKVGWKMKEARQAYEDAWRRYVTEEDRVNEMEALDADLSSDTEAKDAWVTLTYAARHQMHFMCWALTVYEDRLFVTDLVRRVAVSQPWLARFLAKRPSLRPWLEKAELLEMFEGDRRLLEIDSFLFKHQAEMSNRGGSTLWTDMLEDMERVAAALEDQLAKSHEALLFPLMEDVFGQHLWKWLDKDTRAFLYEAESRHRREVLRSDDLSSDDRDHIGEYVLYHKALEVTLTRALCPPFGQVKERSKQLYKLREELSKKVRPMLPGEARAWADLLAERMEQVRELRNESVHRHRLPYDSYMEMRHLVIGSRYNGTRTVSMFWLAYALSRLLEEIERTRYA